MRTCRGVNFYVHAPARTDPSACPKGHDAITVLVPCAPTPSPAVMMTSTAAAAAREAAIVNEVRAVVLERLSAVGGFEVESHLVAERIIAPSKWASTFGLRQGSVFGLAHPLNQVRKKHSKSAENYLKSLHELHEESLLIFACVCVCLFKFIAAVNISAGAEAPKNSWPFPVRCQRSARKRSTAGASWEPPNCSNSPKGRSFMTPLVVLCLLNML